MFNNISLQHIAKLIPCFAICKYFIEKNYQKIVYSSSFFLIVPIHATFPVILPPLPPAFPAPYFISLPIPYLIFPSFCLRQRYR